MIIKTLGQAIIAFDSARVAYEVEGKPKEYFFVDLRIDSQDFGRNVSTVAQYYKNLGAWVYLAKDSEMLAYDWDGNLQSIPPLKNGEQVLLRVHAAARYVAA